MESGISNKFLIIQLFSLIVLGISAVINENGKCTILVYFKSICIADNCCMDVTFLYFLMMPLFTHSQKSLFVLK